MRGTGTERPLANAFGRDQTMPIERRPRSYQSCRFDRSSAIASAPSMWTIAVTSPSRKSSTDRARPTGIAHSVSKSSSVIGAASSNGIGSANGMAYGVAGGSPSSGEGTYSAKNPPANPASAAVSRSMCLPGSPRQRCSTRSL